jgi:hypothetical protein
MADGLFYFLPVGQHGGGGGVCGVRALQINVFVLEQFKTTKNKHPLQKMDLKKYLYNTLKEF